jgi:hypothetical protein
MRRHAEFLQWFGLLGAGLVWTAQLVIGFGVALARCSTADKRWGIDLDTWQITLMAVGVPVAVLAEAAAISVFLGTRNLHHEDPPPSGRWHFFSSAAMLGNALFLVAILLSGIGAVYHTPCQAG